MRVPVTAASKHGATYEIAERIAQRLRDGLVEVDCRPPSDVTDVDGYDAVVLGSAVYAGHWLPAARDRRLVGVHCGPAANRGRVMSPAGPVPPLRGRALLRAWTGWVTLGEAVGFTVPALVGALTAAAAAPISVPALLLAGAVEGAVLGAAQAHVLRRALPGLPSRRWIGLTSVAAVFAYLMGLLPATVAGRWPMPAVIALATIAGTALLLSIGTAQWTVLRRQVSHSGRWVLVTAGAWLAGLAVFLLVATPLWHDGQPLGLVVAIGVLAGGLMAATVAAVTGLGLVRMLGGTTPPRAD